MGRKFAPYFFTSLRVDQLGILLSVLLTSALKNILLYENSFLLVVVFLTIFILDIINV